MLRINRCHLRRGPRSTPVTVALDRISITFAPRPTRARAERERIDVPADVQAESPGRHERCGQRGIERQVVGHAAGCAANVERHTGRARMPSSARPPARRPARPRPRRRPARSSTTSRSPCGARPSTSASARILPCAARRSWNAGASSRRRGSFPAARPLPRRPPNSSGNSARIAASSSPQLLEARHSAQSRQAPQLFWSIAQLLGRPEGRPLPFNTLSPPAVGFSPRDSCTIRTPALAPMRVAPAATIAFRPSRSRTPPAALTPISAPTTRRIKATSAAVAPPGPKPVDVFTKSAPAALASVHAVTFSSSVRSAASMMTLLRAPASRHGAATASMSRSDQPQIARLERADVDHHVDLARAVEDRSPRLVVLGVRRRGAQRKTHHRADLDRRLAQQPRAFGHPGRVHADAGKPVLGRLPAECLDVRPRRVGLEQRVVDHRRDAAVAPPAACSPSRVAPASMTPRSRSGQHS